MNVFFNQKGVGNVLMISLEEDEQANVKHEKFGDITKITNVSGTILGYNIFQAGTYFDINETGKITVSEELLNDIKKVFEKENLQDILDVDLSPKFVVGHVTNKDKHENADKLNVCQVDVGDGLLQIVCGAANVDANQKVVVAKVGAIMPSGLKITPTTLRGVPSNGMICSRQELGLPNDEDEKGIYVLEDSYAIGEPFNLN